MVYAAAPSGGYLPGTTSNPDCAPGDTDCFVQALVDTDLQNLSLTGTQLSIERGNSIDLSSIIPSTTQYAQTVFVDTIDPNTSTIFDENSPATVHSGALTSDSNNIYIGTDGSSWVWNGSAYITKVISDSTAWKLNNTETDAGASKTWDIWRNGKIGIWTYATNTITSSGSVRINMDSTVSTANTLVLYNPNQANTAGNSIAFRALMDNGNNREMAYIRAQYIDHWDTTRSADLYFSTASWAAAQNRMIIKNNGNIGFWTITPGSNFSLHGRDQSVPLAAGRNFPAILDINSTNTASGSESNILFTSNYVWVSKVANASIASLKETSWSNADYGQASLIFRTSWNSIASLNTEKMRIMGNGNIGIGTSNPKSTLEVNGIIASGVQTVSAVSTPITKSYVSLSSWDAILPRAQDNPGAIIFLRNINNSGTINVTISSGGGQFFDASSTTGFSIYGMNANTTWKTIMVVSDGSNWTVFRPAN